MTTPFEPQAVPTAINFEAQAYDLDLKAAIGLVDSCCDRIVAMHTRRFSATWCHEDGQYDQGASEQLAFVRHLVQDVRFILHNATVYGLPGSSTNRQTTKEIFDKVEELVTERIEWHSKAHAGSSLGEMAGHLSATIECVLERTRWYTCEGLNVPNEQA